MKARHNAYKERQITLQRNLNMKKSKFKGINNHIQENVIYLFNVICFILFYHSNTYNFSSLGA
jgi:hypothetical protein